MNYGWLFIIGAENVQNVIFFAKIDDVLHIFCPNNGVLPCITLYDDV